MVSAASSAGTTTLIVGSALRTAPRGAARGSRPRDRPTRRSRCGSAEDAGGRHHGRENPGSGAPVAGHDGLMQQRRHHLGGFQRTHLDTAGARASDHLKQMHGAGPRQGPPGPDVVGAHLPLLRPLRIRRKALQVAHLGEPVAGPRVEVERVHQRAQLGRSVREQAQQQLVVAERLAARPEHRRGQRRLSTSRLGAQDRAMAVLDDRAGVERHPAEPAPGRGQHQAQQRFEVRHHPDVRRAARHADAPRSRVGGLLTPDPGRARRDQGVAAHIDPHAGAGQIAPGAPVHRLVAFSDVEGHGEAWLPRDVEELELVGDLVPERCGRDLDRELERAASVPVRQVRWAPIRRAAGSDRRR